MRRELGNLQTTTASQVRDSLLSCLEMLTYSLLRQIVISLEVSFYVLPDTFPAELLTCNNSRTSLQALRSCGLRNKKVNLSINNCCSPQKKTYFHIFT